MGQPDPGGTLGLDVQRAEMLGLASPSGEDEKPMSGLRQTLTLAGKHRDRQEGGLFLPPLNPRGYSSSHLTFSFLLHFSLF